MALGVSLSFILKILQKMQKRRFDLEIKLKELEKLLDNDKSLKVYMKSKSHWTQSRTILPKECE